MTQKNIPAAGFEIKSPAMRRVLAEIEAYAIHGRECILYGATGVGKEYAAKHYYQAYCKAHGSKATFEALNCADFTDELAQSELFGHVKGAFTGAFSDRVGILEKMADGILFLDEIGDLDRRVQARLLRALDPEIRSIRRVGDNRPRPIGNIIVICATEQPYENIRPSLRYRLGQSVQIPGISERREDIAPALNYFVRQLLAKRSDIAAMLCCFFKASEDQINGDIIENPMLVSLADEISLLLTPAAKQHEWPGNFRELRKAVDRAVHLAGTATRGRNFLKEKYTREDFVRDCLAVFEHPSETELSRPVCPVEMSGVGAEPSAIILDPQMARSVETRLPEIDPEECRRLARYLSVTSGRFFKRSEFETVYPGLKIRAVQKRLKDLVTAGLLEKSANGHAYRLAETVARDTLEVFKPGTFLELPEPPEYSRVSEAVLNEIQDYLVQSRRGLYLSGVSASCKTPYLLALATALKTDRPVFYRYCDDEGLAGLLRVLSFEACGRGIVDEPLFDADAENDIALQAAVITGYIDLLLDGKKRPVLILDNADGLHSPRWRAGLRVMIRYWRSVTFIFAGKKLPNDLLDNTDQSILEYSLK